ncbi:MAG: tail fiber domain-containing protein [bacterium]
MKSSIEKIDNALADISKINGYQFTRKQTGKPDY